MMISALGVPLGQSQWGVMECFMHVKWDATSADGMILHEMSRREKGKVLSPRHEWAAFLTSGKLDETRVERGWFVSRVSPSSRKSSMPSVHRRSRMPESARPRLRANPQGRGCEQVRRRRKRATAAVSNQEICNVSAYPISFHPL